MFYLCLGSYFIVALPLTIVLYTAIVAAKWGDGEKEKGLHPATP